MRKNIRCRLLISTALLSLPAIVVAQESTTYKYDELGRLIETRVSGGARDGLATGTGFDPAGNRTSYNVSGSASGSPPSPPPPSPPPSPPTPPPSPPPLPPPASNQPPVFVPDTVLSVVCDASGSRNVLVNDTDPEGDLPLSFTLTGGSGINFVAASGAQSITFYAPLTRNATYTVTYTITDARGATATGVLDLKVTGSIAQCGGSIQTNTTGTGG